MDSIDINITINLTHETKHFQQFNNHTLFFSKKKSDITTQLILSHKKT